MIFEKLSTVAHRRKFSLGLGVAQSPVASEKILPWPWRCSIRRFASLDPPLPALDPPLPVSTVRRLIRRCPSPPLAIDRASLDPPLPVASWRRLIRRCSSPPLLIDRCPSEKIIPQLDRCPLEKLIPVGLGVAQSAVVREKLSTVADWRIFSLGLRVA